MGSNTLFGSNIYCIHGSKKAGSNNSQMKIGPSMMEKRLCKSNPEIYTIPNFTEIQSFVSQLFLKEKKQEDKFLVDVFGANDNSST